MRYTTILDLRDWPVLYKSKNVRLVWLHLTISALHEGGYKGYYIRSVRDMADEVGLTPGECRHALKVLASAGLIKKLLFKGSYGHKRTAIFVCKDIKTFKQK